MDSERGESTEKEEEEEEEEEEECDDGHGGARDMSRFFLSISCLSFSISTSSRCSRPICSCPSRLNRYSKWRRNDGKYDKIQ